MNGVLEVNMRIWRAYNTRKSLHLARNEENTPFTHVRQIRVTAAKSPVGITTALFKSNTLGIYTEQDPSV